jgi:hypothetical protein
VADTDLADIAGRLYALPPEDFTAARDAEAKAAAPPLRGQIKALRRPSVSAWLVNRLAADEPDLLDQLLALGPSLASAQEQGRGEDLRMLGQQRRELVSAVAGTAAELGGRTASPQVRLEVEQTLEAALADPDSAQAVRSGRLVRALSYAGFGGVDLSGAVATPPAPPQPSRKPRPGGPAAAPVAAAETRALEAAAALDDAVRRCERAEQARLEAVEGAAVARQAADRADAEVSRLQAELAGARERAAAAAAGAAEADAELDRAAAAAGAGREAVAETQRAAERARAELDALRRG